MLSELLPRKKEFRRGVILSLYRSQQNAQWAVYILLGAGVVGSIACRLFSEPARPWLSFAKTIVTRHYLAFTIYKAIVLVNKRGSIEVLGRERAVWEEGLPGMFGRRFGDGV